MEGSHSGLVHTLGKRARCQSLREFESLTLRNRLARTESSSDLPLCEGERFERRSECKVSDQFFLAVFRLRKMKYSCGAGEAASDLIFTTERR